MSYINKTIKSIILFSWLALLTGCTVQPLHHQGKSKESAPYIQAATMIIDEAQDKETQILRNRLVYLLGIDSSRRTPQSHRLSLNVTTQTIATVQTDVGDRTDRTGRPSSGTVRAQVSYILRDLGDNILAKGQRSMTAPFDRPRQEYANLQAEEDAKRRALEELAQQIALTIAHDLSKIYASSQN